MRALDRIGDFTAEYGGWLFGGLFILLLAIAIFLAYQDAVTCAEWGPECLQTTYVYDVNLKMVMPQTTTTRDCVRRKP